jgi:hypothetical protein
MDNKDYLGDGVYAEFDGFGIVLMANVPTTDVIYLEPEVLDALVRFYERQVNKEE